MDRRYHPRRIVRRPGQISQGGNRDLICSIRNVSQQGAKLEVPGASWIGYAFDLRDVMTGAARKCSVVWRHDIELGIRFTDKGVWPETRQSTPRPLFGRRGRDGA